MEEAARNQVGTEQAIVKHWSPELTYVMITQTIKDRLATRLHSRVKRRLLSYVFNFWRLYTTMAVTRRQGLEHAAQRLQDSRQVSKAMLTWTQHQYQAKLDNLTANQVIHLLNRRK